jgi:hypothetical protein
VTVLDFTAATSAVTFVNIDINIVDWSILTSSHPQQHKLSTSFAFLNLNIRSNACLDQSLALLTCSLLSITLKIPPSTRSSTNHATTASSCLNLATSLTSSLKFQIHTAPLHHATGVTTVVIAMTQRLWWAYTTRSVIPSISASVLAGKDGASNHTSRQDMLAMRVSGKEKIKERETCTMSAVTRKIREMSQPKACALAPSLPMYVFPLQSTHSTTY